MMEALINLILKNNSEIVFLNLPTYQEVFKTSKRMNNFNPSSKVKAHSLYMSDGILSFHRKNLTPMLFTKDQHWTPSGHNLATIYLFNDLAQENLVPRQ